MNPDDLWPVPVSTDGQDILNFAAVQDMRLKAEQDETYDRKCIYGEKVYYVDAIRAYSPGHIYSHEGMSEMRISGCCEFHFDSMFEERDDDDDDRPIPFGVILSDDGTPVTVPLTAENVQQVTLYPSATGGIPVTVDFTPPKEGPPWQLPEK